MVTKSSLDCINTYFNLSYIEKIVKPVVAIASNPDI